jgi:hypothetical protein
MSILCTVVELIDKIYRKGVTLAKQAFRKLNEGLTRQPGIEKVVGHYQAATINQHAIVNGAFAPWHN